VRPRRRVSRASVRANLLHPRPHRSPPVAADAGVHARHVTRRRRLHHESCHAAVHAPVSPRHAFPGRLPCPGEVTAVGQACRATAARRHARSRRAACCAGWQSWAAPWAARTAPVEAELGHAPCGRGPRALCTWVELTSSAWAMRTVQLGRARFRPSGSRFKFSIFRIYSNPYKFKKLCRIHLNSENYETNFVGKILICTRF
jgi:hypothetical protein